jgi:predicted DNA binding protein
MTINFETYVPSGDRIELFFSITGPPIARDVFVEQVTEHPSVIGVTAIDSFEDQTLLAIEWVVVSDSLFQGIRACDGQIMTVTGTPDEWQFSIRFRTHKRLGRFREYCEGHGIDFTLLRIYRLYESRTELGTKLFGMTETQHEALIRAVEKGYFAIPR